MKTRRNKIYLTLLAVAGLLAAGAARGLETNAVPPLPPLPKPQDVQGLIRKHLFSPVQFFRLLLGMSPVERQRALAGRSAADQAVILAKVHEYLAMPRAVREARLCQTELHWELEALMKLPAAARTNRLREVSPRYRPMMDSLLREWDTVPAATQKALLERQDFLGLYLRMQGSPAAGQKEILDKLSPGRRAQWDHEMGGWLALPQKERAELCAQFQRFCAMTGQEQKETVSPLSPQERQALQKSLRGFEKLPAAQRAACVNSFGKFGAMGPQERAQFLRNAARWESMTSSERQIWRDLVRRLPRQTERPPLPPGLMPTPPMPPTVEGRAGLPPMPPLPPNVTAPVIIALSPSGAR